MYDKNIQNNFRNGYRVNRDIIGDSGGEEDPLQNPRPPERIKSGTSNNRYHEQNNFLRRAKRLSCRLSERASVLWPSVGAGAGSEDAPPPIPRHRTDPSKYDTCVSDRNRYGNEVFGNL